MRSVELFEALLEKSRPLLQLATSTVPFKTISFHHPLPLTHRIPKHAFLPCHPL
jgi:hypothetical protein